jgi:basic membrane lipoprotein Med (substrate-binding protein (PBP1-ABC) superfamily)
MSEQFYKEAQRLAQKERRACQNSGQDPYLPVLDDRLPPEQITGTVSLGLVQVPAELIVGTKSAGRTTAFARNFMPLLEPGTEFADKWERLCTAHMEEGIRDPIKVYEYLNRYYVEEGNKRVSVLKFFDAVSIAAEVTRILPQRNGDKQIEIYYEYTEFYQLSKVNFIEFSKLGSYAELQRLLGKGPEETWTEEERKRFSTTYHYFRQAYLQCGGKKLASTVGDALLAYMRVYGYQELRGRTAGEIRSTVEKVWEEISLQQEEAPIDLKLDPEQVKKPGILSRVLSGGEPKVTNVAFIHDKTPGVSGWTRGHEQGRMYVQRVFRGKLQTTPYLNAMDHDPLEVLNQAIEDGNTILFTTSPCFMPDSLRAAVEHPEVTIMNCSLNTAHRYVRTYYARMYEAKFIIGAIAGSLTMSDRLGYLCDYPIYGQIAGINAFALGAQMVNPRARVQLEWSAVGGTDAAYQRLTEQGITLISSQDMTRTRQPERSGFGLFLLEEGQRVELATPVWKWGVYYERMLRRILNGDFQSDYTESDKALNYYWGMSAGVVDLQCSDRLPQSTRKLVEFLRGAICNGSCYPFSTPIRLQNGNVLHRSGDVGLDVEQIINMDWLVENVEGTIPSYTELSDTGKAVVEQVGVEPSTKEQAEP